MDLFYYVQIKVEATRLMVPRASFLTQWKSTRWKSESRDERYFSSSVQTRWPGICVRRKSCSCIEETVHAKCGEGCLETGVNPNPGPPSIGFCFRSDCTWLTKTWSWKHRYQFARSVSMRETNRSLDRLKVLVPNPSSKQWRCWVIMGIFKDRSNDSATAQSFVRPTERLKRVFFVKLS